MAAVFMSSISVVFFNVFYKVKNIKISGKVFIFTFHSKNKDFQDGTKINLIEIINEICTMFICQQITFKIITIYTVSLIAAHTIQAIQHFKYSVYFFEKQSILNILTALSTCPHGVIYVMCSFFILMLIVGF